MEVLTSLDRERISELRARGAFFWLDLVEPSQETIASFEEVFDFHPIAVEDTLHFRQRPKLDEYGEYALLVYYGVSSTDQGLRPVEVHLFLHGDFIITVHHDPCAELDDLRVRLRERDDVAEQFIVYKVIDALTDTFFPVMDDVDEEIDALEDAIVQRPTNEQLGRLQDRGDRGARAGCLRGHRARHGRGRELQQRVGGAGQAGVGLPLWRPSA